ncbi:MAG: OmpA family protein, partial [Tannerella sp.]|nr:OmpA family protein [Tannerella sp.]
MKQKIIVLLISALFAGNLFAQGLNEFIIGKDYNSQEVFHKSNGCTPDDGVIVFNTTIPNLKFSMVDTPKRLKNVSVFDAKNNCYVLCIQPTDKNIGGITKYSIDITAEGYKREIIDISEVRATETQYFAVKSKKDVLQELDELKQRLANLENKAVPQSNTVDIGVSKKIDSQPKEVETLKSTTVNSINEGQATKVAFDLSILFKTGFTSLTSATEKSLTKLANDLKANPNTTVGIYGYTDSKENSSIKSKKRADAAKEYLIKQGVSSSRIVTDGFGSSNPIADNNTRKGREQNRRVEIYILPTEKKLIQEDQIATLKQEVSENKVAFDLSILFDSNFFKTLTSATKKSLTKLANDLKANPNTRVEIYGYTDSKERSNIKLSQNRANTARDYLIEQGVSSSRIVTDGFGSSNPIADNNTRKGREQNRRVEI